MSVCEDQNGLSKTCLKKRTPFQSCLGRVELRCVGGLHVIESEG